MKYNNINTQQLKMLNSLSLVQKILSNQHYGVVKFSVEINERNVDINTNRETLDWELLDAIKEASDKATFSYSVSFYKKAIINRADNTWSESIFMKITIWN